MINIPSPPGADRPQGGFSNEELVKFVVDPDSFAENFPEEYERIQQLVGPGALIVTEMQEEFRSQLIILAMAVGTDLQDHIQYPQE